MAKKTSTTILGGAGFPEEFYRVTDPEHPMFAPRVNEPPDRGLIESIKQDGVGVPLICKEIVIEDGRTVTAIICGRRRHAAATSAFTELKAAGLPFPGEINTASSVGKIAYILRPKITDAGIRRLIALENAQRKGDSLKDKIQLAQGQWQEAQAAAEAEGEEFSERRMYLEIANSFGVNERVVRNWLLIPELPAFARKAILQSGNVELAGKLAKMSPEGMKEVLTRIDPESPISKQKLNAVVGDIPQADDVPSGGGPRDRSQAKGARTEGGEKKLYAPRGPKLETGIKLVQARLDELTAKIAPIEDDEQDWADGFDQLKEIHAQTVAATRDFMAFARGEPIEWLAPPPAKAARKQSPPKAPKTPRAPKADKPARAGRATPEEREAKKERKAQEKIEARRAAAITSQRAGRVNLHTREGQVAYLEHMREAVRSRVSSWATADLLKIVGGTANSVRAYLEQLEGAGEVQRSGNGRSLRWTAITASAENQDEGDDGSDGDGEDSGGEADAETNDVDDDRHVELDADDQPVLFEP